METGIASEVVIVICIPKQGVLHSILQNSNQPEVTLTQVRRIWPMAVAHHVVAPHFVNRFLSVGRR
jgi:hypothetical protein